MSGAALVVADKLHAELGASSASRWMACPGSVQLTRRVPDGDGGSVHAREGTAAHALAELCLRKNVHPDTYVGTVIEGFEVTEDMAAHTSVFVEYCRNLMGEADEHGIEERFSLAELNPPAPMFGTADFWAYNADTFTLEIVDLKFGQGVRVEVKGNKQLRYYGLGAGLKLGKGRRVDHVKMTIVQPRVAHVDGLIRSDEMDLLDLVSFASELMEAAHETLQPDAPLVPGDHCRWCRAAATCPALAKQALEVAQSEFSIEPDVPPSPASLPDELFAEMLPKLDLLEDWIKTMQAHALSKLERGEQVPGFKLVERRANRKWQNEEETRRWLQEHGYADEEILDMSLKSPAQIEKVMGKQKKELPGAFVVKRSSGYTMAPETDVRPAVQLSPGEEFDVLPSSSGASE